MSAPSRKLLLSSSLIRVPDQLLYKLSTRDYYTVMSHKNANGRHTLIEAALLSQKSVHIIMKYHKILSEGSKNTK